MKMSGVARSSVALLLAVLLAAPSPAVARGGTDVVTRVVNLLKELKARTEADGVSEQAAFDKFACWCEETTSRKAASITSVKAELQSLGNTILQLKGTVATAISEIQGLQEDAKKNEEQQEQATVIRRKENAAYEAQKVELMQAIASLEAAITVLGDAHKPKAASPASLLRKAQVSAGAATALARLRAALASAAVQRPKRLAALGKAAAAAAHRYAPQSATIQGILHNMYDTFTNDLEMDTQAEGKAHRAYEDLMATYRKELLAIQQDLEKQEQRKAEAEIQLADGTQSFADSEKQLGADVKFFDATKASCLSKTTEWSERKSLRTEELKGMTKAIDILTSPDAKALLGKAIKPGFSMLLQEDSSRGSEPLARARGALEAGARRGQSLRLAALAASMRAGGRLADVGHFDAVLKAIDDVIVTLQKEEAADEKKVVDCKKQYQDIALAQQDLEWKIKKNTAKLTKLKKDLGTSEAEEKQAVADLAVVEKDMKDAKTAREAENKAYLEGKTDDEKAIALLEQARDALADYYKKNDIKLGSSMLQNTSDVPPETKFSDKGSRKTESKGIVSLLNTIIDDLHREISSAKSGEEAAQLDYEKSRSAAEAVKKGLEEKITNLKGFIAQQKSDITAEEKVKGENEKELGVQKKTKTDLQPTCDWYIKHQAERREKRKVEMDGLRSAKEYLAGSEAPSMVQRTAVNGSDDDAFPRITFASVSFLQRR